MSECLCDLAHIEMGQSPPGASCNSNGQGLPLLNGPTEFGTDHPRPVKWTTEAKRIAKKGDLLFCVRGSTTGRMNWADQDYAIGRGLAAIRPRKLKIDRLIRAVIEMRLPLLLLSATGSTFPNVSRSQVEKLGWICVSDDECEKISSFFSSLDHKITLNRRTNETLEAMARALFQSWFVDFDPVKARLAAKRHGRDPERAAMAAISGRLSVPPGKPKDETLEEKLPSPEAIDAAIAALEDLGPAATESLAQTAALFPDGFQESELGLIPEGWEVQAFTDRFDINPKRVLKKGTSAMYVEMKSVPTVGPSVSDAYLREFTSGSKFRNGDTLLARITPCLENGKTGYVDSLNDDEVGWGSTEFIVIRPKEDVHPSIGYFFARSEILRSHAIQSMVGTSGRQRIANDAFSHFWVPLPASAHLFEAFGKHAGATMSSIRAQHEQSRTLAELRDTLLPKLLSGELTVGAAKEAVEAVI